MAENQKQSSTDEIDLLELLAKAVIITKSNFRLIVFAFFLGTLLGLAFYQFTAKTYESRMLISSNILTESYSKSLIVDLEKLIKEKNFDAISSKLNLSLQQATDLVSIEIKGTIEKADEIKETEKSYLTVTCRSHDNETWPSLQNGLINFFETNEFVKIRVDHRKKYINEIVSKIDKELVDLNELKLRIANGQLSQSSKDNLFLFDPTTVHSKILELNKDRINLQSSLDLVNSVQLVKAFTVFKKPASPKLSISLAAGSSIGVFFVILIIGFKFIQKMIRLSEEKLGQS